MSTSMIVVSIRKKSNVFIHCNTNICYLQFGTAQLVPLQCKVLHSWNLNGHDSHPPSLRSHPPLPPHVQRPRPPSLPPHLAIPCSPISCKPPTLHSHVSHPTSLPSHPSLTPHAQRPRPPSLPPQLTIPCSPVFCKPALLSLQVSHDSIHTRHILASIGFHKCNSVLFLYCLQIILTRMS